MLTVIFSIFVNHYSAKHYTFYRNTSCHRETEKERNRNIIGTSI